MKERNEVLAEIINGMYGETLHQLEQWQKLRQKTWWYKVGNKKCYPNMDDVSAEELYEVLAKGRNDTGDYLSLAYRLKCEESK